MTQSENQDYLILKKLIPTKGELLSNEKYNDLVKDIAGDSNEYIKKTLLSKGYIQEYHDNVQENNRYVTQFNLSLTRRGEMAYNELNKKHQNEKIKNYAFWVLFGVAIISAIYAGATYHSI